MNSGVPSPWIRRPVAIIAVLVACILVPVVGPIALIVALVGDLIRRDRGIRYTRSVLVVALLLLVELGGLIMTAVIWLLAPLGYRMHRERVQNQYRYLMRWWGSQLFRVLRICLPLEFDYSQLDPALLGGNAIVIGRHRSNCDAILPAVIFGSDQKYVLYTLKEELRWEPNIDIVGQFMSHRFITRSPPDLDAELAPIRELGSRIDANSVAIIFPEGTFFSENRKAKVLRSLERKDPSHAEAARNMNYVLPPRPAGTLALMEGAPTADIIVLGHVGYEPYGTIRQVFAHLGHKQRITVRAWRYPRDSVPVSESARIEWLFERWSELDTWITEEHRSNSS
jgi:1-acyl-sn-glycerol-3-phosphate acyltransferase